MQEEATSRLLAELEARFLAQDKWVNQLTSQINQLGVQVGNNETAGVQRYDHLSAEVERNRIVGEDQYGRLSAQVAQLLVGVQESMTALSSQLAQALPSPSHNASPQMAQPLPNNPPVVDVTREPKLQLPNRYEGQPGKCQNFLAQCEIFFQAQPSHYSNEKARICFIMSLLAGNALDWVGLLITSKSVIVDLLDRFQKELISMFNHNMKGSEAATRVMNIKQGKKSVAEFAILFRSMATSTRWSDEPLMSLFVRSLSEPVRDALALVELPTSLNALVESAIRVDNRIREREREGLADKSRSRRERAPNYKYVPASAPCTYLGVEPMQVDGTGVRKSQKYKGIICYHCQKPGHIKPRCPNLNEKPS